MTSQKEAQEKGKQSICFWTEGAIEAIAVEQPVRFLLALSSAFLVEEAGRKRALFLEGGAGKLVTAKNDEKADDAKLVKCTKNKAGKECLWFFGDECANAELLLLAKNSRCNVRLAVDSFPDGGGLDGEKAFKVSRLLFV